MPRKASAEQPAVVSDRRRGRGSKSNLTGRFETEIREDFDDGWESLGELKPFKTEVRLERAKHIITTNDSPDIGFDQSINPYRGCEHGCIYCFARPTHCYLGLSAGLDFESVLIAKTNTAEQLERELANPRYQVKTIALGTNTDPYQPIERIHKLTRQILQIMDRTSHPVGIVTKSALVLRDLDLLTSLAKRGLVRVMLSVTTLDPLLARKMEPRATTPRRRIEAIARLADAGVPVGVMTAPIVPAINDGEIEAILERCAEAGARDAGYVLLRLPLEIRGLFQEWLAEEFPDRAKRTMSLMRSTRGGKDYVSTWGERQRGTGPYAELIAQRFRIAVQRLGLNRERTLLRNDLFEPPKAETTQLDLFKS
ncbi:MAG TPA: PA0069 family radical SAM protein [Hyphomicrobiales bacterium]